MTVRLLLEAKADVGDAMSYYERQRPGLGIEFADEFDRAIRRLEQFPESGAPLTDDMRRSQLDRFPYGIIYYVEPQSVVVLAVMHLHRRPDAWRTRLRRRGGASTDMGS